MFALRTTVLPNGLVLIAGGFGGETYLDSAELYDPGTLRFTVTEPMSTGRYFHSATLLPNGKVLVAGGFVAGPTFLKTAELYDPGLGGFTAEPNMIAARCDQRARSVVTRSYCNDHVGVATCSLH